MWCVYETSTQVPNNEQKECTNMQVKDRGLCPHKSTPTIMTLYTFEVLHLKKTERNKIISDVNVSSNSYLKFALNFFVNAILIIYCRSVLFLPQFQRHVPGQNLVGHDSFLAHPFLCLSPTYLPTYLPACLSAFLRNSNFHHYFPHLVRPIHCYFSSSLNLLIPSVLQLPAALLFSAAFHISFTVCRLYVHIRTSFHFCNTQHNSFHFTLTVSLLRLDSFLILSILCSLL